jgi:dienelactone hydrolase
MERVMIAFVLAATAGLVPQSPDAPVKDWRQHLGDPAAHLKSYFAAETAKIERSHRVVAGSAEERKSAREERRREFREMLGLDPMPPRTELRPKVTGVLDDEKLGITVTKLHFQSMPGLYVTANLYQPRAPRDGEKFPAILYLCGHGPEKKNGYSYGNKTHYMHHPTWFARNGFVCLVIDTLQLGEIEGLHHGTYRLDQWWWVRRGYTPAGVEAWNATRAIDYLCSLPGVDEKRIGVTGRSGGGVGTWYLAAIDDRPAVLVPVAGLTTMRNHVIDGCIESHCDCNYFLNYYRWDFSAIAALAAPRPLLLANSDADAIFPLDGVMKIHGELQRTYDLHGARSKLGLTITPGPHSDTPDLRVPAFRWMSRHLKGEEDAVVNPAKKHYAVEQLRVLSSFPEDARNKRIQEEFVALAPALRSGSGSRPREATAVWRARVMSRLMATTFRTSRKPEYGRLQQVGQYRVSGVFCRQFVLQTEDFFRLPVWLYTKSESVVPARLVLEVATDVPTEAPVGSVLDRRTAHAVIVPRGMGPTRWPGNARRQNHIRRRFLVLGRTLAQTRIYDVRMAIHRLRGLLRAREVSVELRGAGPTAEIALFATILEPNVAAVQVLGLPKRGRRLELLGVNRFVRDADIPELVHPRKIRIR